MRMKKRTILLISIFIVAALLAGVTYYGYTLYLDEQAAIAAAEEEARLQAEIDARYAVPDVAMVVDAQTISELDKYTNLKNVDLTGSTCYAEIARFMDNNPGVNVTYTVDLGGTTLGNFTSELELENGAYDYDTLVANLKYLPDVENLSLPVTELSMEQIQTLREAYPDVDVQYSILFLGEEVSHTIGELDLSAMDPSQIGEAAEALAMLPNVTAIELMDADGNTNFSVTDVKTLMDVCPGAAIYYTFQLFGKTVTTETETVEYVKQSIGNEGEAEIRAALDIMPYCTYMKFDTCGIDSEVMASIRDDYPNTKIVWRVFFSKFNCLTDSEMLRLTNGLENDQVEELKYCTDAKYMDLGHNDKLSDISFIAYMPKLEIVILSGSVITDLSCFENHQNIEFLELVYCTRLEDITPLASCPNLKYVNVSFTKVSDLSALDDLDIQRLNSMHNETTSATQQHFTELHPDCISVFSGKQPYGYGWRYNDRGYTFWDYYANMREIFMYDDVGYYTGKENK